MYRSSAVLILLQFFISYSVCDSTTTLPPEQLCNVTTNLAVCNEGFDWPLNVNGNVTAIIIRSGRVRKIDKTSFEKYKNLQEIDVSNCSISEIDSEAFVKLPNLTRFNLADNKEFELPSSGYFLNSTSLKVLNLSLTSIVNVTDDVLENLPNLEILDLSGCPIGSLTPKPFKALKNFTKLYISKDDRFNTSVFCDDTTVKTIVSHIEDGPDEVISCANRTGTTGMPHSGNATHPVTETNAVTTEPVTAQNVSVNATEDSVTTKTASVTRDNVTETIETVNVTISNVTTQTGVTETKPKTEENTTKIDVETTVKNESKADVTKSNATEVTEKIATTKKIDDAKPEIPPADNAVVFSVNNSAGVKKMDMKAEETQQQSEDTDVTESASTSSASSGTNIVLGIIVCVMVVGAAGFGYRYWKNRRQGYRNPNTDDSNEDEGKELQNIIAHHADEEN